MGVSCEIYDIEKIASVSKSTLYQLSLYNNMDFTQTSDSFNVHDNDYVYFVADLKNSMYWITNIVQIILW